MVTILWTSSNSRDLRKVKELEDFLRGCLKKFRGRKEQVLVIQAGRISPVAKR